MASYTLQGFTNDASSPDLDATNLNEMDNAIKIGHDFADGASATPSAGKAMVWSENASGTFDPELSFAGGSTGISYTDRSGVWQKIGNRVDVGIFMKLSSKGSSTGQIRIGSLPFRCGTTQAKRGSFSAFGVGISCDGSVHGICTAVNSAVIYLATYTDSGAERIIYNTDIADTAGFFINGSYFV